MPLKATQDSTAMHTSRETDDSNVTRVDATSFEATQQANSQPSRELVRDVAANLKSLASVLPYPEYRAIVHRIAQLRWRCALAVESSAATSSHPDMPNAAGKS